METEEHDGEDNSAVLVNITAPHSPYSVRRLRWRKCGQRQLDMALVWRVAWNMGVLKEKIHCILYLDYYF